MLAQPNGAESPVQNVFIARQPIFDSGNRRVAYELLYRDSRSATDAGRVSEDVMCSDTALHAVVSIGLDRLTAGATAFVNLTREHLLGELHRIFTPGKVVLELLESIDGDPEVVAACERAVADGYTLALDDYDGRASLDPLLSLVKIVKLDVLGRTAGELGPRIAALRARGLTVLAERVETGNVRAMCQGLGCTLFQGFVFSKPETLDGRSLSVEQATMINVVGLLGNADVTDLELSEAFRSHPSLSVALLRIVNAASFGARAVDSIPHAIQLIGRASLSRWLLVMLVTSVGAQSPITGEVVSHTLVRARFCELLSLRTGSGEPAARFLVGLLSRLDTLLGEPMAKVMERLPVTAEVRDALLHGRGPHAPALAMVEAYESGQWAMVDTYLQDTGTGFTELAEIYCEATHWSAERVAAR